jgi:dienelactone hydrolase
MNMQRLPSDVIGLSKVMPPLSRRGFMSSSAAAAAGYTLAAGPVRADAIHTGTNGLDAGMTKVKVADGEMPAYYARPKGARHAPIVLICMEIFGLHEWVKDITRRMGHAGAFAIAPNYYFRSETNGVDLTKIEEIPKLIPIVNVKKDEEFYSDLDSTVAWAKSEGGNGRRLGVMGFCRGGRGVWHYSTHNPDLKSPSTAASPTRLTLRQRTRSSSPRKSKRRCWAFTAPTTPALRSIRSRIWKRRSRPPERRSNLLSIPARHTALSPTTGRAIARTRPRTHGSACLIGSESMTCSAK